MIPFNSNFTPNFSNLSALGSLGRGGGFGVNPPLRQPFSPAPPVPSPVGPGNVWGGQPPIAQPYPVGPIQPAPVAPTFGANPPARMPMPPLNNLAALQSLGPQPMNPSMLRRPMVAQY